MTETDDQIRIRGLNNTVTIISGVVGILIGVITLFGTYSIVIQQFTVLQTKFEVFQSQTTRDIGEIKELLTSKLDVTVSREFELKLENKINLLESKIIGTLNQFESETLIHIANLQSRVGVIEGQPNNQGLLGAPVRGDGLPNNR